VSDKDSISFPPDFVMNSGRIERIQTLYHPGYLFVSMNITEAKTSLSYCLRVSGYFSQDVSFTENRVTN
jgi:hypothetical protein